MHTLYVLIFLLAFVLSRPFLRGADSGQARRAGNHILTAAPKPSTAEWWVFTRQLVARDRCLTVAAVGAVVALSVALAIYDDVLPSEWMLLNQELTALFLAMLTMQFAAALTLTAFGARRTFDRTRPDRERRVARMTRLRVRDYVGGGTWLTPLMLITMSLLVSAGLVVRLVAGGAELPGATTSLIVCVTSCCAGVGAFALASALVRRRNIAATPFAAYATEFTRIAGVRACCAFASASAVIALTVGFTVLGGELAPLADPLASIVAVVLSVALVVGVLLLIRMTVRPAPITLQPGATGAGQRKPASRV